jgi:hypothetical protein
VIATVTPAKGDLSDLHLASHSSSGAEDACATEYAFSPDRVEYTCKQLFQDARLTVIATAPDADRVEATYKTRSCVSCPFESKTIRVRSGEAFDIDGYYVPFGEERTNYVEATLRTIRRGQTTEHPISLVSRQWR